MRVIIKPVILLLVLCAASLLQACSMRKNQVKTEPAVGKQLPSTGSTAPASFHCEAIIIAVDSAGMDLHITRIIERGSSLFYLVNAGDTIYSRYIPSGIQRFQPGAILELLIEERLKLNSEKPEFITKKIYF